MYVTLDSDNGGILLNLGVGGLAFQAAGKLNQNQALTAQFRLPGSRDTIQAMGQVAWLGLTQKDAGIRFMNLPASVGQIIAEWIAHQEAMPIVAAERAAKPDGAEHANFVLAAAVPHASVPGTAPKLPAVPAAMLPNESRAGDSSRPPKEAPANPLPAGAFIAQPENPRNVFNPPKQPFSAELPHPLPHQQPDVTRPAAKPRPSQPVAPAERTDRFNLNKLFQTFFKRVTGIAIRDDKQSAATPTDGVQKPFFISEVRGTWYWNGDGSSRQRIIRDCVVGEELRLIPELDRFGALAVKICRTNGEQLGYWDEDSAITKSLSCARHYCVTIHEIYAFKEDSQKKGVKLRIDAFD